MTLTCIAAISACVLSLAPAAALAQADAPDAVAAGDTASAVGPMLDCHLVGARIVADGLNAAWLVCRVSGASDADTSFTVSVVRQSGGLEPRPLCTGVLNAGDGSCQGGLVDRDSSLRVTAVLAPSGAALAPLFLGPASATPPEAPMQFYPLGD